MLRRRPSRRCDGWAMTSAERWIGLPQQRECLLWKRIGLRQHRNTRLHEHLILRKLRRLEGDVCVANPRLSSREALTRDLKIRNGGLEAVLNRAVFRSRGGNRTDRAVDIAQRALRVCRRRDVHGCQADARQVQIVQTAVSELPVPLLKPMKTSNELVDPLNSGWPLNSVTVAIRSISDRSATNS